METEEKIIKWEHYEGKKGGKGKVVTTFASWNNLLTGLSAFYAKRCAVSATASILHKLEQPLKLTFRDTLHPQPLTRLPYQVTYAQTHKRKEEKLKY